ncbi:MAG: biotin--[acetyl-CoA-carboxylase] ligase [Alphaproteobacteria bacterium]
MPDPNVLELANVGSTNTKALELASLAKPGAALVDWVVAAQQTQGRGRHGRHWHSPPGNLYATRLIRTQLAAQKIVELTLVAGIAVHEVVSGLLEGPALAGQVALKWPNDLLVGGAKISGILIQTETGKAGLAVAVGIGINVKSSPQGGPAATSLHALGWGGERGQVFKVLVIALDKWMGTWDAGAGFAQIRQAWSARSMPVGADIQVRLPRGRVRGTFEGLDVTGALLLREAGGTTRKITTGDVLAGQASGFVTGNISGEAHKCIAGQKE